MSYKIQFQKHECKYCITCSVCHNCLKNRASIFREKDFSPEEIRDMFEHSAYYHFQDTDPQYIIVGANNEKIVTTPDRFTLSVTKCEKPEESSDDSIADENIIGGPDNKKIVVTNAVSLSLANYEKPELYDSWDDSNADENRIDECVIADENRSNEPISKNNLQNQINKPVSKYNLQKQTKKPYYFQRVINEQISENNLQIPESSEQAKRLIYEQVSETDLQKLIPVRLDQIKKPFTFQRKITGQTSENDLQKQIPVRLNPMKKPYTFQRTFNEQISENDVQKQIPVRLDPIKTPYAFQRIINEQISEDNLQNQISESSEEDEPVSLDCSVCNKTFSNKRDLEIHLIYHSTEEVHKCKVCGMLFEYSYELIKHSLNHRYPKNVCEFCKKEFRTSEKLRIHVTSHTGEFPFSCVVCDRGFKDYTRLKSHLLCHTEDKPFVCDKCGKGFRRKSQLRTHSWVHSEVKPFACQFCEKPFNYKCNLRLHVQRTHMIYDPDSEI